MSKLVRLAFTLSISVTFYSAALADPHKDESGHGRGKHGREHKQEYWDGDCKVARKWKKNGGYKEERKCRERPDRHSGYGSRSAYPQQQPYVVEQPPTVIIQPQIVVRPYTP